MDFNTLLTDVLNFLRAGFNDVNSQILGIIIALVAAYAMSGWRRLWIVTLGAMVAHLVIRDILLPLIQHQTFHLPTNLMDKSYWIGDGGALNLYAGYFIVIAVFYFLKKHLLSRVATAH
ncbi:MAG TPA: hypothetical protein VN807_05225 [Candidatus Sulfotelmatobacter sp.]|jgi:hypothetical protein|nr:hypothetical protein [Candidatus Sulfotelmatobacter sp.]